MASIARMISFIYNKFIKKRAKVQIKIDIYKVKRVRIFKTFTWSKFYVILFAYVQKKSYLCAIFCKIRTKRFKIWQQHNKIQEHYIML